MAPHDDSERIRLEREKLERERIERERSENVGMPNDTDDVSWDYEDPEYKYTGGKVAPEEPSKQQEKTPPPPKTEIPPSPETPPPPKTEAPPPKTESLTEIHISSIEDLKRLYEFVCVTYNIPQDINGERPYQNKPAVNAKERIANAAKINKNNALKNKNKENIKSDIMKLLGTTYEEKIKEYDTSKHQALKQAESNAKKKILPLIGDYQDMDKDTMFGLAETINNKISAVSDPDLLMVLKTAFEHLYEITDTIINIITNFPIGLGVDGQLKPESTKSTKTQEIHAEDRKKLDGLGETYAKIANNAKSDFNTPEEYNVFLNNLKNNYTFVNNKIVQSLFKLYEARDKWYETCKPGSTPAEETWSRYAGEITELIAKFKEEYKEYLEPKSKQVKDGDVLDRNWYITKLNWYRDQVASMPGAPPTVGASLKLLTGNKFYGMATKYPDDINLSDTAAIKQVIHGVKPLVWIKKYRREIKLERGEETEIAPVLAPEKMGGGVIYYRPYRRGGERPADERILGRDPEADKEDRPGTKPYEPYADDQNWNVVELFIWNNVANTSDPRIYNFINGLCLGYPKDYVIWFCESKYGMVDHREPDKSFWGGMIDKLKYGLNVMINGSGRPGTIKADNAFTSVLRYVTPNFVNDMIRKAFGTDPAKISGIQDLFSGAVAEFKPLKAPPEPELRDVEFEESIAKKLNSI